MRERERAETHDVDAPNRGRAREEKRVQKGSFFRECPREFIYMKVRTLAEGCLCGSHEVLYVYLGWRAELMVEGSARGF